MFDLNLYKTSITNSNYKIEVGCGRATEKQFEDRRERGEISDGLLVRKNIQDSVGNQGVMMSRAKKRCCALTQIRRWAFSIPAFAGEAFSFQFFVINT